MDELKKDGSYTVSGEELASMRSLFDCGCSDEEETRSTISYYFDEYGYLIDPHTAVAAGVYNDLGKDGGNVCVIVSTANPYKFPADVLEAVDGRRESDPYKAAKELSELTATEIPEPLSGLDERAVRFTTVIDRSGIDEFVLKEAAARA